MAMRADDSDPASERCRRLEMFILHRLFYSRANIKGTRGEDRWISSKTPGATALGGLWGGAEHLDQHGVVDIAAEGRFNGLQVSLVAVAGE
jgi:hypothetical protein